jgi:hypothetical protein
LEAEDSEGVVGAEDIEGLDRKRSTLGRIWTKSSYQTRFDGRIRNGPAFSFWKSFLGLLSIRTR